MKTNTNVSINEYLLHQVQTDDKERVDEFLMAGAMALSICTTCLFNSLKGVLDTEFAKNISAGAGSMLAGVGHAFGGIGAAFGLGGVDTQKTDAPEKELAELRGLLKRKTDDLTPKELERIKELNGKYDLEGELSANDLKKLKAAVGDDDTTTDDDTTKNNGKTEPQEPKKLEKFTKSELIPLMMLTKNAANKIDDKNKNKENEALFDLLVACSHDKDGNLLDIDAMREKMKDVVGEDKWEEFKNKIDTKYNEIKDSDDFKNALKKFKDDIDKGNIKKEDVEEFQKEAKEHAKSVMGKIEEAKAEQQRIKDEIAEIEQQINDASDDEDVSDLKDRLESLNNKMKSVTIPGVPADPNDPGKGDKDVDDYTNKDIDAMQNELSELDPEKEEDKPKIADLEKKLKAIAKAKGKGEEDFLPKTEMIGDGDNKKPVQKKVGPRGAKYFRTKGENGWGEWRWYKNESDITVESYNTNTYRELRSYLFEYLNM